MRFLILGLLLLGGCATQELIVEKNQLQDVKVNVIRDGTIVKIDTLSGGMIKIKYRD
jgi:hypothetical protein